jgi:hypothetical protein
VRFENPSEFDRLVVAWQQQNGDVYILEREPAIFFYDALIVENVSFLHSVA